MEDDGNAQADTARRAEEAMAAYDLQAELKRNTPLQKLYEEVHFNKYNLAASVEASQERFEEKGVRGRSMKATLAARR